MKLSSFWLLTLALGLVVAAYAQGGWRDWGDYSYGSGPYGYGRYADRAYGEGLSQGESDRANRRQYSYKTPEWRSGDEDYRQAYRAGYDRGYRDFIGYDGQYAPSPYRGYGNRYGGYGYRDHEPYGNPGCERGLQDGRRDGERDRATGHSYRPTHSDNYEDADRGYNSSFGDKKYYKQQYRNGYIQGYEQGYAYGPYRILLMK